MTTVMVEGPDDGVTNTFRDPVFTGRVRLHCMEEFRGYSKSLGQAVALRSEQSWSLPGWSPAEQSQVTSLIATFLERSFSIN